MTVHFNKGKAPWPVSAFVGLLITILLAGGATAWAFAQTMANADHKVIIQRQQADEDAIVRLQDITTTLTFNGVDMMKSVAAIQAQNAQIIALLKGEYSR